MAFSPSVQQQTCFNWVTSGTGSAVVEAVAGAGKTTTLVGMVRLMHGRVFVGAFNKKMGDELKSRTAGLDGVKAGTFHSAGMGVLRYALNLGRDAVTDKKVKRLATKMLDNTPEVGWISAVTKLVSLAKQTGVGVRGMAADTLATWIALIEQHDVDADLPEGTDRAALASAARVILGESNRQHDVIDFDDMIYLPLLLNLKFFKNDWVLVDEAQDTNPTRREMCARMLAPGGRLVAVGDPRQAIFGFTGADNDSLDQIRAQFGATTLELSVTYRCPRAVVAVAREYVDHITAADTAPDGQHVEMSHDEMIKFAEPGDAILCRFNKHLVAACFRLIRQGVAARIEGRDIGEGLAALAGRWKVGSLDELSGRLEAWAQREITKAMAKDDEHRAEQIEDQHETMKVLVQRGAEQGITTVGGLQTMIRGMFGDAQEGDAARMVTLSSVHRSKGLEWDRVFVMGRRELMPSPRAKKPWQVAQEINLIYVAVTRAKQTLVDVAMGGE